MKLTETLFGIASGTVFNHVLLWTIQLKDGANKCSNVCAELHGHEVHEQYMHSLFL